jgi:hypothetical protein
MFHIGSNGVTKNDHLENGHDEDDAPGPGIPEDLDKFLDQYLFKPFNHGNLAKSPKTTF